MEILQGDKIFLRPMTSADTADIIKWRNTDFVRRNFIFQEDFTAAGHETWIKTMIETGKVVQFIICIRKTEEPIGSVYLRDIDPTYHKAEYGIFIGEKAALGQGFGTEAAKLMTTYGFEKLGLHKIMLRYLATNGAAAKSYEKAGFTKEAYLKDEVYLENHYLDVVLMAIFNPLQEA